MTSAAPELIVCASHIHSMTGEPSTEQTAIAVTSGKISGLGAAEELLRQADAQTRIIELEGTLVPAFTDAHAHPVMSLSMARGADLSGCRSLDEVAAALRTEAANRRADGWVLGWGLDPNFFTEQGIGNDVLVQALGADRLSYVTLFDAHSAIASPAALQLAGIDSQRRWPSGSSIVADASGTPTGHLLEFEAMALVQEVLPAQELNEQVLGLHGLLREMAAQGIGEVHVMDMNHPQIFELLAAAEAHAPLPVKLRISPWCTPELGEEDCAELITLQQRGGERWKIQGVKFFIDGTVEGGTAWLETPDSKGESTTSAWGNIEAYAQRIAQLHRAQVPTATHAIGERGIREVVETLAALPENGVQHRIEHIESVPREVIEQMAAAGIAASMQPTHCTHYTKADGSDDWSVRLGTARAARAWCIRDVLDAGAILALGSDYPVAPYPVLPIMADAQLRRPVEDEQAAPILPEQAITAAEALAGYTTGPHSAIGQDGGVLSLGAPGSFTVLDVDPLNATPQELGTGRVLLTVSEGLITFDGNDL
ncbi:amidohydrolase family protein [Glutamicibacter sp.]|uniref:amidohydrolase n=1 Tax=Glutamicibacter sp. TaxID=1931995 RepID=UPI0028BE850B|nr:amidohydrolase family protein [Glutamicibacter sp.]